MGSSSSPRCRTVPVAGSELWTQQHGAGPDVVLISGLGDSHEAWADVVGPLVSGFRVTTLDNRGIGYSPIGTGRLSIAGFADDVLQVMSAWEIEHAHIVGSSMGGAIAQELVVARPEAVQSLALVGTWRRPDPHLSGLLKHLGRLVQLIEAPPELIRAMALWVYSGEAHADGTVERLVERMLTSRLPEQSAEAFIATAAAAIDHDMGTRLQRLGVPTLLLVGGEDRICPLRLSEDLAGAIPGSELRVLLRRGHQPFQEEPQEFVDALVDFWTRLTGSGRDE